MKATIHQSILGTNFNGTILLIWYILFDGTVILILESHIRKSIIMEKNNKWNHGSSSFARRIKEEFIEEVEEAYKFEFQIS